MQHFFAPCPRGIESLLFNELTNIGMHNVKETVCGVYFDGSLEDGMLSCLWSGLASRILLNLSSFYCSNDTELYMGANGIAWEKYFDVSKSIAVDFNGTNDFIRNTQYGALKVKDAICDRFTKLVNNRPNVDKENPDIRIYVHLQKKGNAHIYIDISGGSLHKREFVRQTGRAPLKENLARAIVLRSGYKFGNFIDPMCGSGTLLFEALSLASDTAPGLKKSNFCFLNLKICDRQKWKEMVISATLRQKRGIKKLQEQGFCFIGFDASENMIKIAQDNALKSGYDSLVRFINQPVEKLYNPIENNHPICIVTNPPYGQRMGNFNELISLYSLLGQKCKEHFKGASLAVISTSQELLSCLHLRFNKSYKLFNGALACTLRVYNIDNQIQDTIGDNSETKADAKPSERVAHFEHAQDFANRLAKNLKNLEKWAKKENVNCYRVYDADLPEYQAAIDKYDSYYLLQEYQAPASVDKRLARNRVLDMIKATIEVTGSRGDHVIVKSRKPQKGSSQYEKNEQEQNNSIVVHEKDMSFEVNLQEYIDTGLFLDARKIRQIIKDNAKDKSFLNLFSYTCSVSVAAILGKAKRTLSVDMSKTYLNWASRNFELNNIKLNKQHQLLQADCLSYIANENAEKFDLIYIDPPTFSNSKRMEKTLDVQRDHVLLLANLSWHLTDQGKIIFCTNKKGFKLDYEKLAKYGYSIEDISSKTTDKDFLRHANIHKCFMLNFDKSKCTEKIEKIVNSSVDKRWSKNITSKTPRSTIDKKKKPANVKDNLFFNRQSVHNKSIRKRKNDEFNKSVVKVRIWRDGQLTNI